MQSEGWIGSLLGSFLTVLLPAVARYGVLTVCADNLFWTKTTPQRRVGRIGRPGPLSIPDEGPSPA